MQCFWVLNRRVIDAGEVYEIYMAAILDYAHWFIIHIVFYFNCINFNLAKLLFITHYYLLIFKVASSIGIIWQSER